MVAANRPVTSQKPVSCCCAPTTRDLIKEIALRVLFPFAVLLLLSAVVPMSFQAVVLTSAVISSVFLAAFFFQRQEQKGKGESSPSLISPLPAPMPQPAKTPIPRGLPNPIFHNNCFLNTLAQGIRLSPSLMRGVEGHCPALKGFYGDYKNEKIALGPRALRDAFQQDTRFPKAANDSCQHDVHEALQFFLQKLPPNLVHGELRVTNYRKNGSFAVAPSEHSFSPITLNIPPSPRPANFSQMLQSYFDDSHLEGGDLTCTQRILLSVPSTLFIHIARFSAPGQKNPIRIPPRQQFRVLVEGQEMARYELRASYHHQGVNANSGHYFLCGQEGEQIFCYNDDQVFPITPQEWEAWAAQSYLLQYERVG